MEPKGRKSSCRSVSRVSSDRLVTRMVALSSAGQANRGSCEEPAHLGPILGSLGAGKCFLVYQLGALTASPLRLGCMDSPRRLAPSRRLGGTYFPVLFWVACTGSSSGDQKHSRVRPHSRRAEGQNHPHSGPDTIFQSHRHLIGPEEAWWPQ